MNPFFKRAAGILESRLLPLLFTYFVFEQVVVIYAGRANLAALSSGWDINALSTLALLVVRLLLIVFNVASVYFLFRSSQGERYHVERPRDIFVPLFSTFFILATNLLAYLPAPTNFRMLPESWGGTLMIVGLQLAVLGSAVSLLGVLQLGDSFAIFIQRRRLVTSGPYRFLRHPIYVGYCIRMIGYWLMTTFTHHLAFTAGGIVLLMYRARLEEERLEEGASRDYRAYREATERGSPKLAAASLALGILFVVSAREAAERMDTCTSGNIGNRFSRIHR